MSQLAGFLQAIHEDPQEDTRLIFADWLEEQSDPALALRGEFLRLQCRLSSWIPNLKERTAAWAREQQLLEHQAAWLGPLQPHVAEVCWQRGLAHVTISARRFVSERLVGRWPELFQQAWVEGLKLGQPSAPFMDGIAANPGLAEVGQLDLSGCGLLDDWLRMLLRSPHLSRLSVLDLSCNRLTDHSAEALCQAAGQLPCLKILRLRNNGLTEQGARRLLQGPLGKQLRRLELFGNKLDQPCTWTDGPILPGSGRRPPRYLINTIDMEFTLIPAGTFLMGSTNNEQGSDGDERPQHEVTISRPFYLGIFAVTQQQYEKVVGVNPSHFTLSRGGGPTFPVETVSWQEATEFCRLLTQQAEESRMGRSYRLPTEAEWEYAARSGTTSDLPSYLGRSLSSHQANFNGSNPYTDGKPGPYRQHPLPVGSFPPSPWGLFDVHGNVWEWCSDWYGGEYYRESPAVDPTGPERGERRVLRGGSWLNQGVNCRAAARDRFTADFRYYDNGLRVVMEVSGLS